MFSELQDQTLLNPSPREPETLRYARGSYCPACKAANAAAATYFGKAFGVTASIAAVAESIVDDLGFCSRHGHALVNEAVSADRIARTFATAIHKIQPLCQQSVTDDRCQRFFFTAGHRCPACSAEEAAAAKCLASLRKRWSETLQPCVDVDALCWQHFQAFTTRLAIEPRGQAIQQRLDLLFVADRDLARTPREALPHALTLLGPVLPLRNEPRSEGAGVVPVPMKAVLDDRHVCPICEAMAAADEHWLAGLRWAAEDEAADCLWLFAPSCERHVSEAIGLGCPALLIRITSFALSGMSEQSRQQLAGIVRELALAEQPKPVWYRPRRRRRDASSPTLPPGKRFVLRCRGCDAEAIALERASGAFLDLMRHARYRDLLTRGHGLCLRHLAYVLPVASPEVIRPFLSRLHASRMEALVKALSSPSEADGAWREAVYRFNGWPTGSGPLMFPERHLWPSV